VPQFENNYVIIVQNECGTEWPEGDLGFLTKTTSDAQNTLGWVSAQDWSNGKVGLHGCSSTAESAQARRDRPSCAGSLCADELGRRGRRCAGVQGSQGCWPD
jgi:hypothetical protein